MNKHIAIAAAALGLAASGSAMAQWSAPLNKDFWGYLGASGGRSDFRTECSDLFDCSKKDTGWKVYGGGTWNDVWGLEAGYTDFGKINAGGGDTKAWAGNLSLTAGVPVGDRFRVFAKGGGIYSDTDVNASPSSLFHTGKKTGWGYTYGLGAALGITPTVQVRLDWDRYNMDFSTGTHDVDLVSAGLQVRF